MIYDLETWRLIGWALLVLVLVALALGEGLCCGVLMLLSWQPADAMRTRLAALVAPLALGNLAWLVVVFSLLFGVWPIVYAVALSSLQWPLLLLLLSLLPRYLLLYFPPDQYPASWRRHLDKLLPISAWLPAVLLGLLAGNVLKGIPFHLESDMRCAFLGDVSSLLNPFALLIAATTVALWLMHGASYVALKTTGTLQQHAQGLQLRAGLAFVILFALGGLWISHLEGYHINSEILVNADSNPLAKFVKRGEGLWLDNYEHQPLLIAIPLLAFTAAIACLWLPRIGRHYPAMLCSSVTVVMTTLTAAISTFPFMLPSNLSLNSSLTLWDSSASLPSLQLLLPLVMTALPLMLLANRWLFSLVSADDAVNADGSSADEDDGLGADQAAEARP